MRLALLVEVDHDVVGIYVSVAYWDLLALQVSDSLEQLSKDVLDLCFSKYSVFYNAGERSACNVVHDEMDLAIANEALVHLDDVGVADPVQDFKLLKSYLPHLFVLGSDYFYRKFWILDFFLLIFYFCQIDEWVSWWIK